MTVRNARITDVEGISVLVNEYANRNLMLPRPLNSIYEHLRDFHVIEEAGTVRACGALHILWHDLAEIRSVAVHADHMGRGYGLTMVRALMEDARELGIHRAFMLILPDGPMSALASGLGFEEVSKETLPHKVWSDCLNCPKFTTCDEVAVVKEVGPRIDSPHDWHAVVGAYVRGPEDQRPPVSSELPIVEDTS